MTRAKTLSVLIYASSFAAMLSAAPVTTTRTVYVTVSPALRLEHAEFGQVIGDGTRQSGGRRIGLRVLSGMPRALQEIAAEILHQHVLTYELPDGVKPDSRVSVSIQRKGLSVRAPTRVPDR